MAGWVGWLLSRVQGLHINIAGCKGLEGSKFQMVMVFKTGNRNVKFLEFQSWDFIGWLCRYIDAMCEGRKIHVRRFDFSQWQFAQQCVCVCAVL